MSDRPRRPADDAVARIEADTAAAWRRIEARVAKHEAKRRRQKRALFWCLAVIWSLIAAEALHRWLS